MSIRDLLNARAIELAAADGAQATILHLVAAGASLSAELRREYDALVADFRPAGVAHAAMAAAAESAVEDDAPIGNASSGVPAADVSGDAPAPAGDTATDTAVAANGASSADDAPALDAQPAAAAAPESAS